MLAHLFLVDAPDFGAAKCRFKTAAESSSRIENVAKEEHQILKELHPAVQNIEESVSNAATGKS